MRRQRYDQDSVITEYDDARGRANALFALAIFFGLVWTSAHFVGSGAPAPVSVALNSFAKMIFGWGSITALALSVIQGVYAVVGLQLSARRW